MLSDHEQQELDRISRWFEDTDPDLAEDLRECEAKASGASQEQELSPLVLAAYPLGGLLLLIGMTTPSFPLMFFAVIVLVAAGTAHITQSTEARSGDGPEPDQSR